MSKEQLPSVAAIEEALRRAGWPANVTPSQVKAFPKDSPTLILAAQLIEQHEPETLVDPYLRRARELLAATYRNVGLYGHAENAREGGYDKSSETAAIIRALKEGMGK